MSRATLVEVVEWLESTFEHLDLRRSYGGALAYNFFGPPRLTQDVDVLLLVPAVKIPALVETMSDAGFQLGDVQPQPMQLTTIATSLRTPPGLTVTQWRGVRVELFTPWHPFHTRVLDRSPERMFGSRRIRVHAAEDLIVFKKIFNRPKDLTDIRAMLMAQKGRLNLQQIRTEAESFLLEPSQRELEDLLTELA